MNNLVERDYPTIINRHVRVWGFAVVSDHRRKNRSGILLKKKREKEKEKKNETTARVIVRGISQRHVTPLSLATGQRNPF